MKNVVTPEFTVELRAPLEPAYDAELLDRFMRRLGLAVYARACRDAANRLCDPASVRLKREARRWLRSEESLALARGAWLRVRREDIDNWIQGGCKGIYRRKE